MDLYVSFFMQHWALSAGFIVILVLLLLNEWRLGSFSIGKAGVDPQELVNLLNHSGATVLDMRLQESYVLGHILSAVHIPATEIEKRLTMLNKYKNKPLILVCAKGLETPKMIRILSKNGFTQVYYLRGGMENWQRQNLPMVKN